jgi:hypothetical protein
MCSASHDNGRRLTFVAVRKTRTPQVAPFSSNRWSEECRQVSTVSKGPIGQPTRAMPRLKKLLAVRGSCASTLEPMIGGEFAGMHLFELCRRRSGGRRPGSTSRILSTCARGERGEAKSSSCSTSILAG